MTSVAQAAAAVPPPPTAGAYPVNLAALLEQKLPGHETGATISEVSRGANPKPTNVGNSECHLSAVSARAPIITDCSASRHRHLPKRLRCLIFQKCILYH